MNFRKEKKKEPDGVLGYGWCCQCFEYLKKKKSSLLTISLATHTDYFAFPFINKSNTQNQSLNSHTHLFFLCSSFTSELTLKHTVTQRVWRGQFILFCYCFYLCCFIHMLMKLSMYANTSPPSPGPSLSLSRSRINL